MSRAAGRTRIAVAVCTYDRNGPLAVLLEALADNARLVGDRAALGVVVVDDSGDGRARAVVDEFAGRFELGLHYLRSGRRNISIARNLALGAAQELGDFVAMTDDDCEPAGHWLRAYLEAQARTGADALGGPFVRRVSPEAPRWLTEAPFLTVATQLHADGAPLTCAGTNNSFVSSSWLRAHPRVRFRPELGVTGGEDVVFYRTAVAAGLRVHFARDAVVYENEPMERATLAYQLRLFFWLGNGSYVTRRETGDASPLRMCLQGGNHVRRALQRPLVRVLRRQSPQLRYCLADSLFGAGQLLGALGARLHHH